MMTQERPVAERLPDTDDGGLTRGRGEEVEP
jgi:hypothetical protein